MLFSVARLDWSTILRRTWQETNDDNISLLAAGVAFYSFLAFVPLLASIVLVYGLLITPADIAAHMRTLLRVLPIDAAHIVAEQLKTLTTTPVTRSTLGLLGAIGLATYGAMRGASSVIGALNLAYGQRDKRSFFYTSFLSFAFTLGSVLVAILAMAAISAMSLMGAILHLPPMTAPLVTLGLWLGTALMASVMIALIYRFGPDRRPVQWIWLMPGAIFASTGSLIATFLFGLYVSHIAGYNATYGALGAVVSFLMWLYVTAFVVLLGAELNAEIECELNRKPAASPVEREICIGPTPDSRRLRTELVPPSPVTAHPAVIQAKNPAQSQSHMAPLLAGLAASHFTRWIGDVPVGTLPMTVLSTGFSMIGRKDKRRSGMALLGIGALLVLRTRHVAAARARKLIQSTDEIRA